MWGKQHPPQGRPDSHRSTPSYWQDSQLHGSTAWLINTADTHIPHLYKSQNFRGLSVCTAVHTASAARSAFISTDASQPQRCAHLCTPVHCCCCHTLMRPYTACTHIVTAPLLQTMSAAACAAKTSWRSMLPAHKWLLLDDLQLLVLAHQHAACTQRGHYSAIAQTCAQLCAAALLPQLHGSACCLYRLPQLLEVWTPTHQHQVLLRHSCC
jgi:hypothetical protein